MTEPIHKEYAKLRRRPFLTPLGIPLALGLVTLAVLAWAVLSASTTTVYVMRHAEPASAGEGPLSLAGELRAGRVRQSFGEVPQSVRLDAIFVSEDRRTQDTARPLGEALGAPVIVVPAGDPGLVARRVLSDHRGGRVLVIADAPGIPAIVAALSGETVPAIGDTDFSTVYVVARPRYSPASVSAFRLP